VSFIKRAPELAEEILLKAASPLPESLRSFSRDLLEKKAVDERERLQLPVRMTLADLQKIAHGKQVDLPKIASVSSEEFGDVAESLRKIAARGERELAEDVFMTAAAMVESRQEKAAMPIPRARILPSPAEPTLGERFRGLFVSRTSPTGQKIRKFRAHGEAEIAKVEASTPGTDAYRGVTERTHAAGMRAEEAAAGKRTSKTIGEAVKGIPATAGALGVGAVAAAAAGKKDEKKIVAERAFSS
jgi:hypothetical protein